MWNTFLYPTADADSNARAIEQARRRQSPARHASSSRRSRSRSMSRGADLAASRNNSFTSSHLARGSLHPGVLSPNVFALSNRTPPVAPLYGTPRIESVSNVTTPQIQSRVPELAEVLAAFSGPKAASWLAIEDPLLIPPSVQQQKSKCYAGLPQPIRRPVEVEALLRGQQYGGDTRVPKKHTDPHHLRHAAEEEQLSTAAILRDLAKAPPDALPHAGAGAAKHPQLTAQSRNPVSGRALTQESFISNGVLPPRVGSLESLAEQEVCQDAGRDMSEGSSQRLHPQERKSRPLRVSRDNQKVAVQLEAEDQEFLLHGFADLNRRRQACNKQAVRSRLFAPKHRPL